MVTFDQFFIFTSCNKKFRPESVMWFKPFINTQWWCFVSGNFSLQPELLACFSNVALWPIMVFKDEHSTSENASFMVWEFAGWASFDSMSNGCVSWLAAQSDLPPLHTNKVKFMCCTNSILFVCSTVFYLKNKKTTMTLCVFMMLSEPGLLRPVMMLLGSGVGVLPFTVNPVTPTGSTNCDTGTVTLHCFTFKDSHWHFQNLCECLINFFASFLHYNL